MEKLASNSPRGCKSRYNGFLYVKHKDLAGGWTRYECERRRSTGTCTAAVKVRGDEVLTHGQHTHHPGDDLQPQGVGQQQLGPRTPKRRNRVMDVEQKEVITDTHIPLTAPGLGARLTCGLKTLFQIIQMKEEVTKEKVQPSWFISINRIVMASMCAACITTAVLVTLFN